MPPHVHRYASITLVAFALSGCISTAASIVTAPVRVVGRVADMATTSQDESDRNLGRKMRAREEAMGRLERQRRNAAEDCQDGERDACRDQARIEAEIEQLRDAPL
jgi:PBP1b-binding outer membrane lipoprotein LpoB